MQIGTNLPRGTGMNGQPQGSGGQSSRSQKVEVIFGSLAKTSLSIPCNAMSDGNVALERG